MNMKSGLKYEELDSFIGGDSNTASSSTASQDVYDIVCVGFGPAALSIAIALQERGQKARVMFLERQPRFGWHCGMLFPEARMQISFIKDLATLRNPQSEFTYLNYLHQQNRLVAFTNLSTTLPLREEFNDYMSWCASHFQDWVEYGKEVSGIYPGSAEVSPLKNPIRNFSVVVRDIETQETRTVVTKNVIIATGGKPAIPFSHPRALTRTKVIHSSDYLHLTPELLSDQNREYNLAVVGGGQSSAEIFDDLSTKYPQARIVLITRSSSLKPSDDSPFVNEIFDPSQVDRFFSLPKPARRAVIQDNRLTNYGVVRMELLEHLYARMYHQRIHETDESKWRLRMMFNKGVISAQNEDEISHRAKDDQSPQIQLRVKDRLDGKETVLPDKFDFVFVATGYSRSTHEEMLRPLMSWFADGEDYGRPKTERDYSVKFRDGTITNDAGVWLQGCCEESHGLSDSLLSILAIRSGELLDSIFPDQQGQTPPSNEQKLQAKL